jgi:ribonuclease VapC
MIVETSALLAIAFGEPERQAFLERIAEASRPMILATSLLEAVLAVCRQKDVRPREAYEIVADLVDELRISIVGFYPDMLPLAVDARRRYGSGKNRLDMGDCLAYAAARHYRAELLYKGDDFALTDVNAHVGRG